MRVLTPTKHYLEENMLDGMQEEYVHGEIKHVDESELRTHWYVLLNKSEWLDLQARIKLLEERDDWLECLEQAGVDNWGGISHAYEIQEEYSE